MHKRYLETLQLIDKYQQYHLYTPSLKDLSDELGITEAGISFRIIRLEEQGWIERIGNRALRITEEGHRALGKESLFDTEGANRAE